MTNRQRALSLLLTQRSLLLSKCIATPLQQSSGIKVPNKENSRDFQGLGVCLLLARCIIAHSALSQTILSATQTSLYYPRLNTPVWSPQAQLRYTPIMKKIIIFCLCPCHLVENISWSRSSLQTSNHWCSQLPDVFLKKALELYSADANG